MSKSELAAFASEQADKLRDQTEHWETLARGYDDLRQLLDTEAQ